MTRRRGIRALSATLALTGLCGAGLVASVQAAPATPIAHAAGNLTVSDTARLSLVHKSGSTLTERGTATGTLPGSVSGVFKVEVVFVTGTVTVHPRGGSVTMKISGVPKSVGTVSKFGGSVTVTGGTGRYAHAHGSGSFSGTVNRRTWATTVTVNGRLSY